MQIRNRKEPRKQPAYEMYSPGDIAYDYLLAGLSIIPVARRTKTPLVAWKQYQNKKPTLTDLNSWWSEWPDANVTCVLGAVSDVFAIDVDGPEAHEVLVERLGEEPIAPKVITGSLQPSRYQLFFRHPSGIATKAKHTPWHPALEFRGHGGLSVLPPSVHTSGRRYRWAPFRSFDDLALPTLPAPILKCLQQHALDQTPRLQDETPCSIAPHDLDAVQRRALKLISKECRAVEGHGGDKATWTAACYLILDFSLSIEQALPVLQTWNETNCSPKWTESELNRKLQLATQQPGKRGRFVEASLVSPSETTRNVLASSDSFLAPIPDFVLGDWEHYAPRFEQISRGRPAPWRRALLSLVRAAAVLQRSSAPRLPDTAVAQLRWGGDRSHWPKRWRFKLVCDLRRHRTRVVATVSKCRVGCPLHGCDRTLHRDIKFRFKSPASGLGVLHSFSVGESSKVASYNFRDTKSHHPSEQVAIEATKLIRAAKREGRLCSVYLPAWAIGPETLELGSCRVLQSLTRELTRVRGRNYQRPDRAEVIHGDAHRLLEPARSYVHFDGNGSRKRLQYHRRGYRLGERLKRAGYTADEASASVVREYLDALQSLCSPFGLVVVARVKGRSDYQSLDEVIADLRVVPVRKMLRDYTLQVYAPEDYLTLWRRRWAALLGVSAIPQSAEELATLLAQKSLADTNKTITPEGLARWMVSLGWCDADLAEQLDVSRSSVCRYRMGSRRLPHAVEKKIADLMKDHGADQEV